MNLHKSTEKLLFDNLYREKQLNADPEIRSQLLHRSETQFQNLIKHLSPNNPTLEIGCGDGTHSILAARAGATSVLATDYSEEALKLARTNAEKSGLADLITFQHLDAENPNLPPHSFDVIINHEVFSSIDLRIALPKLAKLLTPTGTLIGKETFGHNPITNLKRHINVLRGTRTKWAAAHIFRQSDLEFAKTLFHEVNCNYYHFLVLFAAPLLKLPFPKLTNSIISILDKLDTHLLKIPIFKKLAFKVVFEFKHPKH